MTSGLYALIISFQIYSAWPQNKESIDKLCVTFEQVVGVLLIKCVHYCLW